MTRTRPSFSIRTQEWVFLVRVRAPGDAFMAPSCYAGGVVSSWITFCATAKAAPAAGSPQ